MKIWNTRQLSSSRTFEFKFISYCVYYLFLDFTLVSGTWMSFARALISIFLRTRSVPSQILFQTLFRKICGASRKEAEASVSCYLTIMVCGMPMRTLADAHCICILHKHLSDTAILRISLQLENTLVAWMLDRT